MLRLAGLTVFLFVASFSFVSTPTQALRVFTCPDGSIPPNGVCPKPPVKPTLTCANIRCIANTQCVDTQTGPKCVPLNVPTQTCPSWAKYNQFTNQCEYQQPTVSPVWPQVYWSPVQQAPVYTYQYPYYAPYVQPYPYHYFPRW